MSMLTLLPSPNQSINQSTIQSLTRLLYLGDDIKYSQRVQRHLMAHCLNELLHIIVKVL
jgi:hypothetical protein